MRILITNDDGVSAPGINTLREHLLSLGHEVIVIAPDSQRSTTGHSLSLDTPLRVHELEKNVYACSGFPADCSLLGLGNILKDNLPDLVVSGINKGANLAQDLYYSGTVGGAREAALHNIPAIAVSLSYKKENMNDLKFITAAKVIGKLIEQGIKDTIPKLSVLNVNVPNINYSELKGAKFTEMGRRFYSGDIDVRTDTRGRTYYWIGGILSGFELSDQKNTDCEAVAENYASIMPHSIFVSKKLNFQSVIDIVDKFTV